MSKHTIWRQVLTVLWCFAGLLTANTAWSERIDPFVATVPVKDQSQSERRTAVQAALKQVMLRLTGQQALVDGSLSGRGLLLQEQQIRYVELPPFLEGDKPQPALEVRFNADSVYQLARRLGLPIWPLERGSCIVWVAIDNGLDRQLLGAAIDHQELQQVMLAAADGRGLPLTLPLMDLQDRQQVSFSDVWAGFTDQVEQASDRYQASVLLMGRVFRSGGRWNARWQLHDKQNHERWDEFALELDDILISGVHGATERLGQRLAVYALDFDERLVIRIYGVRGVSDYSRIMAYLADLSVVESIDPVRILPGIVDLALVTAVGADAVSQALDLEHVLEVVDRPNPSVVQQAHLHYRLPQ